MIPRSTRDLSAATPFGRSASGHPEVSPRGVRQLSDGTPAAPRSVLICALSLVFFFVCCSAFNAYYRWVLHRKAFPYGYPLLQEHFPDLLHFVERFRFFHTLTFFTFPTYLEYMYPAPDSVVYKLFYLFPHPLAAFFVFVFLCLLLSCLLVRRTLRQRGYDDLVALGLPLTVLLCCYPVWFEVKQANLEIVIWALVTCGVILFLKGKGYSSAACFGLAASMKIYPLLYLGLLLVRRQYKQIGVGLTVMLASTVSSLWLVYPSLTVSWSLTNYGVRRFEEVMVLQKRPEMGLDHSLFSVIKFFMQPLPDPQHLRRVLTVYVCVLGLTGLLLFFMRIRRLPIVNQVLCLAIATVLLPPTSYEYTLMHLLVPFTLLVLAIIDRSENLRGANAAMTCFTLIFAFIPELIFRGQTVSGQIKALSLLVLFIVAVIYPFASTDQAETKANERFTTTF